MFQALLLDKAADGSTQSQITSLEPSALPAGEVRVAVAYSTVNYKDALAATGTRLERLLEQDVTYGGAAKGFAFTATAAKYIANAMAYDDVIGVADLKTRAARFAHMSCTSGSAAVFVSRQRASAAMRSNSRRAAWAAAMRSSAVLSR